MTFAFAGRRARDRVGLIAALAATAAALTAGLGGFTVVADRVLDDGAARLVADADPIARSVVLDGPLRGAEQTARAEEALAEHLPSARVHRQIWGTGTGDGDGDGTGAAPDSDGDGVRLRVLADEDPPAHLIDGTWPAGPGEAAIAAPAAKLLGDTGADGGEIGDEITVDGMPLRVVGVWEADDVRDTAWAGEPSVASGRTDDAIGPLLVDEATTAALAQRARATWIIEPADTTAAGLGRFAEELRGIEDVRDQIDPGGGDGLRVRGDLPATLRRAVAAVTGARALLAVPLIVLAAVGGLMLGVLVRTLAAARRAELQLMRARGGALAGIAGAATVEAVIAAAAGAVVGAAAVVVAHLLGAGVGAGGGPVGAGGDTGVAGVAGGANGGLNGGLVGIAVGAAIVLVVAALTAASTASAAALPAGARAGAGSGTGSGASTGAAESGRDDVGRSGLRSIAALLGPLVAVAGAAALALAQLMGRGLVVRGELDPLAAAAPALLLITGALLAALLAGPIAAGAQRLARRTRGLGPVLALRRIARQSSTVAVAVIAVALAAASVVFVAVTGATATRAAHADVAMVIGADARARFAAPGVVDATHAAVTAVAVAGGSDGDPTGADAFAGLAREVRIGDERVTLIAAPVDRLTDGDEGLAALPDLLTADPDTRQPVAVGVLPAAGTVSLSVTGVPPVSAPLPGAEAGETRVAVALWFVDVDGVAVRVDGGTVPADSAPHPLAIAAPDGHRLVAIEFAGIRAGDGVGAVYTVVDADGAVLLGGAVDVIQPGHPVRVLAAPAPQTVPVAMTAALAERLAADVGDELSLTGGSLAPPLPVRIAAIRPQLPGLAASRGVLADQGMLTAVTVARGTAVLAAGDVWVGMDGSGEGEVTDERSDETTDAGARAAAADTLIRSSAVLPVDVLTASSVGSAAVTDPALTLTVVAVGLAAALAVVAFAVVVVANARRRRAETVPLRSFGFTRAHQRAVSLLEAGMVAVFALAVGAGLGFGVAVLTGSLLVAPVIGGV